MRIVHVTCLYVPEHRGGAPQQCHQIAVEQAARGHDVAVFSGTLADRPPLQVEKTVQDGLPVTRIVTTEGFAEEVERNWRHPAVEPAFREFLEEQRPDVAHFHSIQSLGASLIPIAAASGARTVVTMHDLWWICQRRFGMDRRCKPCIPAMAPGSCRCQCGVAELYRRREYLTGVLRQADLVLAPSASVASRLRMSGVEGRVEVDPNSVPQDGVAPAEAGRANGTGPLRLLYVGGDSRQKGLHVLAGALRLCSQRGVSYLADLYGMHEIDSRARALLDGVAGRLRGPFDPADRDGVMDAHDVLVLPSLGHESSSLAVREALVRGLAVVATECGGPQEVVEHEVNGLLVPQDDAGSLAAAIARLADDRELLGRLRRAGARGRVPTPEAHAESLERLYHSVRVAGRATVLAAKRAPEIRQVLFVAGIEGTALRYRVHQKVEQLGLLGIGSVLRRYSDPRITADLERSEVVIVCRAPATRELLRFVRRAHQRRLPVLFDADELVFDPELVESLPDVAHLSSDERALLAERARRQRATLLECGLGVASTSEIARHMARLGVSARVHRDGVDTLLAVLSERARRDRGSRRRVAGDEFVIGYWPGARALDADLASVAEALAGFLRAHPEARLVRGGPLEPPPELEPFGARVGRLPATTWERHPDRLASLDLNIVPLVEGAFNEARSAVSWMEAALVEVPTLAAARQPFRDSIDDGRTGFLARDAVEWRERLEEAIGDRDRLGRVGRAARLAAFGRGSPWLLGRSLLDVIRELWAGPRAEPLTPEDDRWPSEVGLTNLEPAGLLPGLHAPGEGAAAAPGELLGEHRVGFELPANAGPLRRVDVWVAAHLRPAREPVTLSLHGPDGGALRAVAVPAGEVGGGGWLAFEIDPPLEGAAGRAVAELSAGAGDRLSTSVTTSGRRLVDGRPKAGALAARTFHQPPIPPDFAGEAAAGARQGEGRARLAGLAGPTGEAARRAGAILRTDGPIRGTLHIAGSAHRLARGWWLARG